MSADANSVIHVGRKILKPAYLGMLAGLLVRSVALVLSVGIPYDTWPVVLRIIIEGVAALGMVACADIVLGVASASKAQLDRQITSENNSLEYQPNPRLAKDRYAQMKEVLDARRAQVVAGLEREAVKERNAIIFGAFVTISYGILFGVMILARASWIAVCVEVIGVATIPFVTWYLSAQYKEPQASPDERAKGISLMAVDARLKTAHGHFGEGAETVEDLNLLDVATKDSPLHNRLVRALRKQDASVKYLTTPELYTLFGVTDSSGQATIRRIVRKSGENQLHGVTTDSHTGAWLTPESSIVAMFPRFIGLNASASIRSPRTSIPRTKQTPEVVLAARMVESRPARGRTTGEYTQGIDEAVANI